MSEGPIFVQRTRSFDALWRMRAPLAVRSLWTTGRHFLRNLLGSSRGVARYPERRPDLAPAFRGLPVLLVDSDGRSCCSACGRCESVCPTACLRVVPISGACRPRRFDLDAARCLFCGLCQEVCPEAALAMSPAFELAAFDRASLRFDMQSLLVPRELLAGAGNGWSASRTSVGGRD